MVVASLAVFPFLYPRLSSTVHLENTVLRYEKNSNLRVDDKDDEVAYNKDVSQLGTYG